MLEIDKPDKYESKFFKGLDKIVRENLKEAVYTTSLKHKKDGKLKFTPPPLNYKKSEESFRVWFKTLDGGYY